MEEVIQYIDDYEHRFMHTFKCSLPRHDCAQRDNAIPQVAQTKVLVVGVLVIVEVRERNTYGR